MMKRAIPEPNRRVKSVSELSSPQQKRLYNLLQREELNAKRARVGHVLVQQYTKKYGTKAQNSAVNTYIKSAVKEALLNTDDVQLSEAILDSLESSIRATVETLKSESLQNRVTTGSQELILQESDAAYKPGESLPEGRVPSGGPRTAADSSSLPPINDDFDPNQWSVMNAFLALNDEDKTVREKEASKKKMSDFKKGLDNQTQMINDRAQKDDNEKQRLAEMTRSAVAKVEDENRLAKQRQASRANREKALRQGQIEERLRLRQMEKEAALAQEQNDIDYNRAMTLQEEARKRLKKEQQKRLQDAVKLENAKNKALKDEMLWQQAEYDAEQTREYHARQIRSDEAKAKAFKARVDTQATISANYDAGAGSKIREKKKEEEIRVNEEVESKNRADAERERQKAEARRKEMDRSKDFNQSLINRKEQARQQEKDDAIRYRLMLEKEAEKGRLKEEQAIERRREFSKDVKRTLDVQAQKFRTNKAAHTVLSAEEIALNRDIISKIERDQALRHKLAMKMNASGTATTGLATSGGFAL